MSAVSRRWQRFVRWALSVGMRTKILGMVLGVTLLLGGGFTLSVNRSIRASGRQELAERSLSIASDVAARSTDLLLTNDLFSLHQLLRETLENHADVRYVIVLQANGRVVAHTFAKGVPPMLLSLNHAGAGRPLRHQLYLAESGVMHDAAAAILHGEAGEARVGLSEQRLNERAEAAVRRMLLFLVLVSVLATGAAMALTHLITRPIHRLVAATEAIGSGDFQVRAPVWSDDEIGRLCATFNNMTAALDSSLRQQQEYNRRILRQNEALATINRVASVSSQHLDLDVVLPSALSTLQEWLQLQCGEVLLCEPGGQQLRAHLEECGRGERQADCRPWTAALAARAAESDEPSVAAVEAQLPCGRTTVLSVPLLAGRRVVGIINLLSTEPIPISIERHEALGAIGRQLGVAVEKARLWEELKRKEELRTRLLQSVISAQEEERQRVARELHDQLGQMLTSLGLQLALVDDAPTLDAARRQMHDVRQQTLALLDDVRGLARRLRPAALDELGLVTALEKLTHEVSNRNGLTVGFHASGVDEENLPDHIQTTVYRIAQEGLTNVVRHSGAHRASIVVRAFDGLLSLVIEDDGRGFDMGSVLSRTSEEQPLGLFGMRERASLVGGTCDIETAPQRGVTVAIEIPLPGVDASHATAGEARMPA